MKTTRKDLLLHVFKQMDKIDEGLIEPQVAMASAALARQANNIFKYDLDKAALLLKIEQAKSNVTINDIGAVAEVPDEQTEIKNPII